MSGAAAPGPGLTDMIEEMRGLFASNQALEDAISRLAMAGIDRADISLPASHPAPERSTPEQSAGNPNTADDQRQSRTLHTSLAGSIGGLAAAALVIGGGGATIAALAAATAGAVGAGAVANGLSTASGGAEHRARETAARRGELLLSVHLRAPEQAAMARQALQEAGASRVETLRRVSA